MNTRSATLSRLVRILNLVLSLVSLVVSLAVPAPVGAGTTGHAANASATRGERLCSALAHLFLLVNAVTVVGGFVAVAVLRAIGPRGGYFKAQARQAMIWQVYVWIASLAVLLAAHLLLAGWMQLLAIPLEVLLWGAAALYALCAALICLAGRPFHYRGAPTDAVKSKGAVIVAVVAVGVQVATSTPGLHPVRRHHALAPHAVASLVGKVQRVAVRDSLLDQCARVGGRRGHGDVAHGVLACHVRFIVAGVRLAQAGPQTLPPEAHCRAFMLGQPQGLAIGRVARRGRKPQGVKQIKKVKAHGQGHAPATRAPGLSHRQRRGGIRVRGRQDLVSVVVDCEVYPASRQSTA